MSSKAYAALHNNMSDKQKNIMYDLYMSGLNMDGHVWCQYGKIEEAFTAIYQEQTKIPEWVSTKLRCPRYGQMVLCFSAKYKVITIDTYYGQQQFKDRIAYWMELPEIPEAANVQLQ